MKILVEDYTFDKNNKLITFTGEDFPDSLEKVLIITNVTTGEILYNFADRLRGGSLSGKELTLSIDSLLMTGMSNTDKLQIFIDSDKVLEMLFFILEGLYKNTSIPRDAGDRLRVVMDNNPMLYSYMRNSSTAMAGSNEPYYSTGGHTVVDAREQLKSINDQVISMNIGRWTTT